MSRQVDVLAVMQRSANVARCNSEAHPDSRLLRSYAEDAMESRAAVEELIEAADAATEQVLHDGMSSRAACDRLIAALARAQGVQS